MKEYRVFLACVFIAFAGFDLSFADVSASTESSGVPIEGGHVVVRGDYIRGPYRVTLVGDSLCVNDVRVAGLKQKSRATNDVSVASLERCLYRGCTVIVFDERTRLTLDSLDTSLFWQSLLEADTLDERVEVVFAEADYDPLCSGSISTSEWRRLLHNFEPSSSLLEYVASIEFAPCSETDVLCGEADAELSLQSQSSFVVYALNTVGMLLAVVSFGVLINNRPTTNAAWGMISDSEDALGLTTKCVTLSVVLSMFDLISTVAAASITDFGFIEVNPFAASIIDSPSMLTVAKLLGTGLSASLLWSLRQYVGAQQASWWICFVLTLVTARWVVVDSLFVC